MTAKDALDLTPRAQRAMEAAAAAARARGHDYVGTEHILIGLLRDSEGIAGQVAASLNVRASLLDEVDRVMRSVGYSTSHVLGQ